MSNNDPVTGKFLPGNKASPGRQRRQTEMQYVDAIISRCTPEVWDRIVARAVHDAESGDKSAREWLEKYVIGTPPPIIDLPLIEMNMLAFVISSLKARGADFSEALGLLVDAANIGVDLDKDSK